MKINIETEVNAALEKVWAAWTNPEDIKQWNAASDDWHTTRSEVDLREGGSFCSRMEAKDGSFGFDFAGKYTKIIPNALIEYELEDGRVVSTKFENTGSAVKVAQEFDADDEMSAEQQRTGWQSILNNFARHVQSK